MNELVKLDKNLDKLSKKELTQSEIEMKEQLENGEPLKLQQHNDR